MKKKNLSTYSIEFFCNLGFFVGDDQIGEQKVTINFSTRRLTQQLELLDENRHGPKLVYSYMLSKELRDEVLHLVNQLNTNEWASWIDHHFLSLGEQYWSIKIRHDYTRRKAWESREAVPEVLHQIQAMLNEHLETQYPIVIAETIAPDSALIEKVLDDAPVQEKKRKRICRNSDNKIDDYLQRIKERVSFPIEAPTKWRQRSGYDIVMREVLEFLYFYYGHEEKRWLDYELMKLAEAILPINVRRVDDLSQPQALEALSHFVDLLQEDRLLTAGQAERMRRSIFKGTMLYFANEAKFGYDLEKIILDGSETLTSYRDLQLYKKHG